MPLRPRDGVPLRLEDGVPPKTTRGVPLGPEDGAPLGSGADVLFQRLTFRCGGDKKKFRLPAM